ncbi:MAG TPA: biopolymer transporter ExbD [Verrucomicrobiae bacterium]|nr:biopolymer transporter ExbD [Verrucomicrobiae bacterium]
MKFPRNARIFRGQLDAAPFISVFFLLVLFVLLGSLVYTPGVRIQLPSGAGFQGVEGPTLAVAVDAGGRFYFRNQLTDAEELATRLDAAVKASPRAPTLVVHADKNARRESLDQLASIARQAGISELLLATLPRP